MFFSRQKSGDGPKIESILIQLNAFCDSNSLEYASTQEQVEFVLTYYRILECILIEQNGFQYSIECILYSIPEARKVVRKDFQGLSPAEEVIAEMSTHLLCKRLHYVLGVNRIHTRVFLSVNQIQTTSYMISFMTVTVVMPMDR